MPGGIRGFRYDYDEAEESREQSGYRDIDGLEQSCCNEGVLDTRGKLRKLLREQ